MRGIFLAFLVLAFEPLNAFCPGRTVLGGSALDSFAPHVKGAAFHVFPHDGSYLIFFDAVLHLNGFEGCAVFPRHFEDSAYVTRVHSFASLADTSIASIFRRLLYKSDLR